MAFAWLLSLVRCLLDSIALLIAFFIPAKRKLLPPIKEPLLLKSASQISNLVRSRQVSCVQVVKAYIDRINECEPFVHALVDERFQEALKEAEAIDTLLANDPNASLGPLIGVPFTGKDSHAVKGLAWTAGLVARKGSIAPEDAPVVANLKAAGAICLGITNAPELAFWFDSDNKLYGRTNNPYDLSRIPGGSTGGNAALISYGGSLIGNASDIGGSIRMPSAFCGIYGHKPTPFIVNTGGHYPEISQYRQKFLSFGPLCRFAQDIAPTFTAMAGGENVINEKLPRFHDNVDWSAIKVFYQLDGGDPFSTRTKPYIKEAMLQAVNHFKSKYKSTVEEVNLPEFAEAFDLFMENFKDPTVPSMSRALMDLKGEISVCKELALSLVGKSQFTLPSILICLIQKFSAPAPDPKFVSKYIEFRDKFNGILGQNGIFLFPSHPEVAPKHKTTVLKVNNAVGHCGVFNLLETPVTTCPLGLAPNGLPMSMQIVAAPSMDHLTIAAANELDGLFGGWRCPSPVELDA